MRVLMLNYEFPPLGGGAGHATACLLREFSRREGLAIDLVASSAGRARVERLAENIFVHYLDIGKRGGLHYQTMPELLAYAWKARWHARRLIRQHHYELCHAFFGIPCGCLAGRLGLPYIVSLRGSDVPFYNERFRGLDRLVFRQMSVRTWKGAAFVVANSQWLRRLALRTAPQQHIEVIGNGVDTQRFRPARSAHAGLRVLCVARLIARKRIDVLMRAVAAVGEADVHLTIVGSGNEERPLRELARQCGVEDRVSFAGNVPRGKIVDCYHRSDVFVLPSLSEGMSNAALEAMACGLPIVMTNTGGAAELLRDGENGILMGGGSVREVSEALRRYLEEPELARTHGARSREIAEGLSWEKAASQYAELYARAGGESR